MLFRKAFADVQLLDRFVEYLSVVVQEAASYRREAVHWCLRAATESGFDLHRGRCGRHELGNGHLPASTGTVHVGSFPAANVSGCFFVVCGVAPYVLVFVCKSGAYLKTKKEASGVRYRWWGKVNPQTKPNAWMLNTPCGPSC